MSLLKKLAGETAIYGLSSILGRLLNYIILATVLTRIFTKEEYGVVGVMYASSAILMVLFTYRMETAFFRFGKEKQQLNKTFSTTSILLAVTSLVLVLVLFAFSTTIAAWLSASEEGLTATAAQKAYYFRIFAVILAADALSAIPFARLRLINRPIVFAVIRTINIAVNILFIVFFLLICPYFLELGWPVEWLYNPEDRIQYVFIANLLASVVTFVLLSPSYFRLKLVFDWTLAKQMLLYAWPLIIAQMAGVLNLQMGILFIEKNYEEDMTGIYSAAVKIPILMTLFTQAFNYAAEPFFFRNADASESKKVYAQVAQAFAVVGVLVFMGIVFYIDLLQYILGKDFRSGLGIVPIFLIAYFFLGLFYNFSIWYKLTDRTIIGGYIALIGTAISFIVNAILVPIPSINIYGPAWAALFCFAFMAGAAYWTGQKQYKIDYPIRSIGLYLMIGLSGYFLSEWGKSIWEGYLFPTLFINTLILLACLIGFYFVDSNFADSILKSIPWKRKSK